MSINDIGNRQSARWLRAFVLAPSVFACACVHVTHTSIALKAVQASNLDAFIPAALLANADMQAAAEACRQAYNAAIATRDQCYYANTAFKVMEGVSTLSSVVLAVTAAEIDDTSRSTHRAKEGLLGGSLASAALFAAFAGIDIWSSCGTRAFAADQLAAERRAHLLNAGRLLSCAAEQDAANPKRTAMLGALEAVAKKVGVITPLGVQLKGAKTHDEVFEALVAASEHAGATNDPALKSLVADATTKTKEYSSPDSQESKTANQNFGGALVTMNAVSCLKVGDDQKMVPLTVAELKDKAHAELISCQDQRFVSYGANPAGPPTK